MAIQVTKATDAIKVETLCFTVYSQPGLGKTSLSFTSSRPLLLDFDKGAHRAVERKDTVQVTDWKDIASITASDVSGYDTIIIDTVGKALDTLAQDIIRGNSRLSHGGALSQQGWGQLGVRFSAFLKMLRGFGKDIVLISHMDEQKDGDAVKERLKISGGSKDLILTDSDVIARISIISKQRYLVFSPTETSFGKDPANISEMPIPDAASPEYASCLSEVITLIKNKLNALSEDQVALKAEMDWFTANLPEVDDVDGINLLVSRAKRAGRDASVMLHKRAIEIGLVFDKEGGRYVGKEIVPPTPPAPPPAHKPNIPPSPPVVDHVADSIDADQPEDAVTIDGEILGDDSGEEFDANEFFNALEAELLQATSVENLEEAWTARDPLAVFDGDDQNIAIALAIKTRALKGLRD